MTLNGVKRSTMDISNYTCLLRQDKIGAIPLAVQAAAKERNVKVKILVPANIVVQQRVQQLKQNCPLDTTIDWAINIL